MTRKPLHTFSMLLCVVALATVNAIALRQSSGEPPRSDLQAAVDRFRSAPADILGVQEPISVIESYIYADGGSIYVRFRDAKGIEFLAMRLSDFSHPPERCRNFLFGPDIPNPMQDLPELPAGSSQEQALCGILIRWSDNDPTFSQLASADEVAFRKWDARNRPAYVTGQEWREKHFHHRALVFTWRLVQHAAQH